MEKLLLKVAEQVPALIVMLVLVIIFLRAMEKRDDEMKVLWKNIDESHRFNRDVIIANTKAMTAFVTKSEKCCEEKGSN